jgi:hypothetical protein
MLAGSCQCQCNRCMPGEVADKLEVIVAEWRMLCGAGNSDCPEHGVVRSLRGPIARHCIRAHLQISPGWAMLRGLAVPGADAEVPISGLTCLAAATVPVWLQILQPEYAVPSPTWSAAGEHNS